MSDPMFYFPGLSEAVDTATLDPQEAGHAASARRLDIGDRICLFDGQGTLGHATVSAVNRRARILEARVEQRLHVPAPRPRIELACALPKGDRQAVLLDIATQLGMIVFTPLECERSAVKRTAAVNRRWQRICLEACKQSRRAYLPAVRNPGRPAEVVGEAARAGRTIWVAHPSEMSRSLDHGDESADALLVVVGPEGGFTDEEVLQMQRAGAHIISLGSAMFRVETAAIALLAFVALRPGH